MNEQITTLAELEALPPGSVILDSKGNAGVIGTETVAYADGLMAHRHMARHLLPATVLYRPDGGEVVRTTYPGRIWLDVETGVFTGDAEPVPSPAEVAEGIAQAIEGEGMISTRDLEPYWEGWHDAITKAARIATEYGQGSASVTRTGGGGWITTCPHPECDWQAYHPTLRGADKALNQHTRDKHPKERP